MSGAELIVRAGGIVPLVAMLRAGSGGAKRCAAPALAQLARTHPSNQAAIAGWRHLRAHRVAPEGRE